MHTDVFVYGTLQDPEVLGALLDDPPPLTPVTITGWRVAPVRGRVYPGLVRDPGASASGHHLRVTADALEVLDRFEGPAYDRRPVGRVRVDGRDVQVQAWVVPEEQAHRCAPGTWTLQGFLEDPERGSWIRAIRRGRGAP